MDFKVLPAACAQQILKKLCDNWKAFYATLKAYKQNPDRFLGRPRPPKYLAKNGENLLTFTNQQCKIINGFLTFPPKATPLKLKTRLNDINLREIRIVPLGDNKYSCEIVYQKEISVVPISSDRIVSLDLGVRNIFTMANNWGDKPVILSGGVAKSTGQFYNKEKARLKSIHDKQMNKEGKLLKSSKRLRKLDRDRNNKVNDQCHKASRMIVNYAKENNVGKIVIGKNQGWKQEADIGKRNNQQFVSFPHARLIEMIQYKAKELGIEVILQEEAHTSKCSFLDYETIEHHEKYVGVRNRGIFKTANGNLINADVNGAYNIMVKAIPNAFKAGREDTQLHPEKCFI